MSCDGFKLCTSNTELLEARGVTDCFSLVYLYSKKDEKNSPKTIPLGCNYTGTQSFTTTLSYSFAQKLCEFLLDSSKLAVYELFNH